MASSSALGTILARPPLLDRAEEKLVEGGLANLIVFNNGPTGCHTDPNLEDIAAAAALGRGSAYM